MQRILILGGGVGGTLTANLLVKKLRAPDRPRRGRGHGRRRDRPARLPAGLHVHRDGRRAGREPPAPERSLLDKRVDARRRRGRRGRRGDARSSTLADGLPLGYDQLVLATGSRIVPEAIEHFDTRGPALLHGRGGRSSCARRSTRSTAGGSSSASPAMPYKCPPAPLEVAFLIEAELRERGLRDRRDDRLLLADRARLHDRERLARWRRRSSPRRASSCTRSSTSRRSTPSARSSRASRARSCRTTSSSSCRRTRASSSSSTPASRPRRAAGCRPTARPSRSAAGRTSTPSATRPTCPSPRPARRRTSRRRS